MSPLTDAKGEITHVIEAIRDVTELVKTGKDPLKNEEKHRHLVESSRD